MKIISHFDYLSTSEHKFERKEKFLILLLFILKHEMLLQIYIWWNMLLYVLLKCKFRYLCLFINLAADIKCNFLCFPKHQRSRNWMKSPEYFISLKNYYTKHGRGWIEIIFSSSPVPSTSFPDSACEWWKTP